MAKRARPILSAYVDCTGIMQRALDAGGIRVEFPTPGRAINFRQRCYRARKILAEAAAEVTPAGVLPSTQFDDLYIRLESDAKPDGSNKALLFQLHSRKEKPLITNLEGEPLEILEEPNFPDIDFGDL